MRHHMIEQATITDSGKFLDREGNEYLGRLANDQTF